MRMDRMNRREFISLLGGTAATWPTAAHSQPAMPVIGFLHTASPDGYAPMLAAFLQGLREAGYVEGRNVAVEYRWAAGKYDQLPASAADLVRLGVAVIAATGGESSVVAAKAATATIPIVFISTDPVKLGLVASLNRPGGMLTGVNTLNTELVAKRLELLHELVPRATIIAALINPASPTAEALTSDLHSAARTLGLQLNVLHANTEREIDTVFSTLAQLRAGGLVIGSDGFNSRSEQLGALTVRHTMPAIYQYRAFAAAGGLMSYGGQITDWYRLAGVYTGRILKGEKPADLPVQQSTKAELIINLKTAQALSITFPLSLLGRADEVIE
jgi:putative tryptophan/tyrosine transport system substrate-binding protein